MARTPLFSLVQNAFRLSVRSLQTDDPVAKIWEHRKEKRHTRREFLRAAAASSSLLATSSWLQGCASGPRDSESPPHVSIAIIGAGLAGLSAALHLEKFAHNITIFESSVAVGGRTRSAVDTLAAGTTVELGAEFIDSGHVDMIELARLTGVELIDLQTDESSALRSALFFDGRVRTEKELAEAFRPLAKRISRDFRSLKSGLTYQSPGNVAKFDSLSLDQYLDRIGAKGWVRRLLDVAFTTEMGLDASEQSSLAMLLLISTDTTEDRVRLYGESDERLVARGGVQTISEKIAKSLRGRIAFENRLLAIRSASSGEYLLDFQTPAGTHRVRADVVCLTIPFSVLRNVELGFEMTVAKRRAIRELSYGTNTKAIVGYTQPFWRPTGTHGTGFSDTGYQSTWDALRGRSPASGAALTFFTGGKIGASLLPHNAGSKAAEFASSFERGFQGHAGLRSGKVEIANWLMNPHSRGSFACYRPGQCSLFAGAEGESSGRVFFAGEHCSREFGGYMNGAAVTGREAAISIDRLLRGRASANMSKKIS